MSIHEFISLYNEKVGGHYFDRKTLKFFGERISEMRVLKTRYEITDMFGEKHTCYCLSSVQRKHPNGPQRHYAYFDIETLKQIII